jgi:hypothetical protein
MVEPTICRYRNRTIKPALVIAGYNSLRLHVFALEPVCLLGVVCGCQLN